MIHGLSSSASGAARSTPPFWLIVLAFWLFTFSVLSWRTGLVVGDDFDLFTVRRLLSTIVGASLFAIVLRQMMSPKAGWASNPVAVLATILPAALLILTFRLLLEALVFTDPLPIEHNLRWVITWSGYFGLWISGALAFGVHLRSDSSPSYACTFPVERPVEAVHSPAAVEPEAWTWLIDALAEELARRPDCDRAALIDSLVQRAGYEIADDPGGEGQANNARILLVRSLARRLLEDR